MGNEKTAGRTWKKISIGQWRNKSNGDLLYIDPFHRVVLYRGSIASNSILLKNERGSTFNSSESTAIISAFKYMRGEITEEGATPSSAKGVE